MGKARAWCLIVVRGTGEEEVEQLASSAFVEEVAEGEQRQASDDDEGAVASGEGGG